MKKRFVVLVCGGRAYHDVEHVCAVLSKLHARTPITRLAQGGAPGVDSYAAGWAIANEVTLATYRADWGRLGNAAGPERNERMLRAEKPDLVLHFSGGRGTADMVARAKRAGIKMKAGGMRKKTRRAS